VSDILKIDTDTESSTSVFGIPKNTEYRQLNTENSVRFGKCISVDCDLHFSHNVFRGGILNIEQCLPKVTMTTHQNPVFTARCCAERDINRPIVCRLSVRPSVTLVCGLWSCRLEYFESNFTVS